MASKTERHFMVMEYVEGSNLRDFLKLRVRLPEKAALPLIVGLAHGLKYSLDRGITHRDIKGTNILISSSGAAKLVDFGLATIGGDDKKMAVVHGQRTVDYSALERTCGSPKGDPRSDIFFLGCVFYQMLTGQLAMSEVESKDPLAKMLKRSFGAIKPLSEQRNAPSEGLTRIIEKMMRMDLKARYQTMDQVVDDLEAHQATFLSRVGSRPPLPPPRGSSPMPSARRSRMTGMTWMWMTSWRASASARSRSRRSSRGASSASSRKSPSRRRSARRSRRWATASSS